MSDAALGDAYRLDDQVGYLLRLAAQRHAAIFAERAEAGLTPTQFAAVMRLAEHGPRSQNELGRLAAMDISTIKGVVDRLREKGLVETRPAPEDRRRHLVSLTAAGERAVGPLAVAGHAITEATLEPLTPAERRTLVRLLRKLG